MTEKVLDHVSGTLSELDRMVVNLVPPGGNWRDLPTDFPSSRVTQIRESAAAGGGSRSTYYGRLAWNKPSYTISTYITRPGNGCHIHPQASRLISVREAARLQTFPDSTRFVGSIRSRAMQVGNAVPPLLAYAIASVQEPGTVVDVFSGVGGLSIGFDRAGHDVIAEADFDKDAQAAAALRAGDRAIRVDLSDVSEIARFVRHVRANSTQIDTVVGGPPCQGFSTAGNCDISDERNRLVLAFIDVVERLTPRRVVMENVPALLWRGARVLDQARTALHRLGYSTSVAILHAEAYGVPQLRRRLVLIGSLDSAPVWPAPTHSIGDPAHRRHQPGSDGERTLATVHDAISDLPEDVASSLDEPVAVGPPTTTLQRWVRGEIEAHELLGDIAQESEPHPDLFAYESNPIRSRQRRK